MPSPLANTLGNANLSVTSTVSGALDSGAEQKIDVALGLPVLDSLADIANAFHLRRGDLVDSNGRYKVKITYNGSAVNMHLTWAQLGIKEGDSIVLASV